MDLGRQSILQDKTKEVIIAFWSFFFKWERMKRGHKTCNSLVQVPFRPVFSHLESVWWTDGDCCCGFHPNIAPRSQFFATLFIWYFFLICLFLCNLVFLLHLTQPKLSALILCHLSLLRSFLSQSSLMWILFVLSKGSPPH